MWINYFRQNETKISGIKEVKLMDNDKIKHKIKLDFTKEIQLLINRYLIIFYFFSGFNNDAITLIANIDIMIIRE